MSLLEFSTFTFLVRNKQYQWPSPKSEYCLGELTNTVLELADGDPGEAIEVLRAVAAEIKVVKSKTLADSIEANSAQLKVQNKAAYEALVKRL